MNVLAQSKTDISLLLDRHEAARLLEGLEQHREALGAPAAELAAALRAAGVAPPAPPNHLRGEYAPPLPD